MLVPGDFNITVDANGDTLIYPQGDTTAQASGRMPQGGYFFDCIVRQEAFDEEHLNPEDNLEEFGPISETDLDYLARAADKAAMTGRGVIAAFGGTAFGDIALVRDLRSNILKAYAISRNGMSPQAADRTIFIRSLSVNARSPSEISSGFMRAVGGHCAGGLPMRHGFRHADLAFCSDQTLRDLYFPYYRRINDWIHAHTQWKTFKHSCGAVSKFIPFVH